MIVPLKSDVPMLQHLCSTVPPSVVSLLHYQMFYCSTIRCSNVPPSVFHCFTNSVSVFHHHMFHCCTISVPLFQHHIFHGSNVKCSTVQPSDIPLFHHQMIYCSTLSVQLFHHLCSTVPPPNILLFNL